MARTQIFNGIYWCTLECFRNENVARDLSVRYGITTSVANGGNSQSRDAVQPTTPFGIAPVFVR